MRERDRGARPRLRASGSARFTASVPGCLRTYAPLVGLDRGFTIYDQGDRLRAVKQVMEQLDLDGVSVTPERIDAVISKAKNDLVTPEAFSPSAVATTSRRSPRMVYEPYQERLRESSAVDFDDLLVHMVTILKEHPRRPRRARPAVPLRARRRISGHEPRPVRDRPRSLDRPPQPLRHRRPRPVDLRLARGEPRATSSSSSSDYPGCKVVKLERNYRSTKNILHVADQLIRHNRRRKAKALTTENPSGAPVELTVYANETDEARGVASKIVEKVREGEYPIGDIAVFCRVTALTA